MEIERMMNTEGMGDTYRVKVDRVEVMLNHMPHLIYSEMAKLIAERYVADHFQEIVSLIDQKAIATLSVAESAAKIRETLEKKLPDKILEIEKVRTEIYQKGILGGITRIK